MRGTYFVRRVSVAVSLLAFTLSSQAAFTTIFTDNFDSGASPQWSNLSGNWTASNGVYYAVNFSNTAFTFLPTNLTDFAVDVDINDTADGGIWLRSDGTGQNGVLLVTGGDGWGYGSHVPTAGNNLYFHVVQNGSYSPYLGRVYNQFTAGVSDIHLRVEVVGNTYSVFLNNAATPATTLTNATFSTGKVGLFDFSSQTFDNFVLQSTAGLPLGCAPVPAGLASWWRAEGDAQDQTAINNGTAVGNVSFVPGRVGQAFGFPNSDGNGVSVGNAQNLRLQDFSIETWFKRADASLVTGTAGNDALFFSFGIGGYGFGLNYQGRPLLTKIGIDSWTANVVISDTNFHHLAITKSGTSVIFYVDSIAYPVPGYANTFTFSSGAALGARGDNLGNTFWGTLDELSVYTSILSASDIQAIYNAGSIGKCLVPVITSQPTDRTVVVGGTATFNVAAISASTYQWLLNDTNVLTGRTNSSLVLANVGFGDGGRYSVLVGNSLGTVTSSNALLTVIPQPPCDPPPSGLVSWWKAENNTLDQVGTNNGTLSGGITFASGEVGQAFALDGTNGCVLIPNSALLNPTNAFSVEVWIKADRSQYSADGIYVIVDKSAGWFHADGWQILGYPDGTVAFGFGIGGPDAGPNGFRQAFTSGSVLDNQWHHVAGIFDGTNVQIYLDAVLQNTLVTTLPPVGNDRGVEIGRSYSGPSGVPTRFFHGLIDEVSYYNRALSAGEVQAIYAADSAGKCLPLPLITSQPVDQQVIVGGTATFNVTALSASTYQWLFNDTNVLSGRTNSSLVLSGVGFGAGGRYSVVVGNSAGSVTSSNALLTVKPLPACDPPPSGLVSWWKAEGNALDQVGTNSGTLSGGIAFAPGEVGQAFALDGTNGCVLITNSASLNPTGAFSVEVWIKADPQQYSADGLFVIVDKSAGWFHNDGWLLQGNPDGTVSFGIGTGGGIPVIATTGSVLDNQWHHLAGVFTGTNLQVYLDAALQNTLATSLSPVANNRSVEIGRSYSGPSGVPTRFFHGLIDEVSYYNRALSAGEIQAIYAANGAGKCVPQVCTPAPSSLVSWWKGEGNALDQVGTNNGALSGGITFASGEVGQAFALDGTNGCVLIPSSASLNPTGAFSVEVWVKANPQQYSADGLFVIVDKSAGWFHNDGWLLQGNPDGTVSFGIGTGGGIPVIATTGSVLDNQWHHLAGVFTGTNLQVYLDAALQNTLATSVAPVANSRSVEIGRSYSGPSGVPTRFFHGLIDEVSYYGRALTAAEIQTIYAAGTGGKCLPLPLITSQPADQQVFVGGTASFSVSAIGALSYQWLFNNTNVLSGRTNSSLVLTNVGFGDGGRYSVAVGNSAGSITSSNALLTVKPIPACDPPPSGLVSWWKAEGNALDHVGTNNGTLSGGVTFSSGGVGQAFSLDGTNGCVLVPSSASLNPTGAFSVEVWIKANPQQYSADGLFVIVDKSAGWFHNDGWLLQGNPDGTVSFGIGTGGGIPVIATTGSVLDNQWHHLAGVFTGTSLQVYLDAALQNTLATSLSPVANNRSVEIGRSYSGPSGIPTRFFHGLIDEVSYYSRALTAAEIQAIYAADGAGKCPDEPVASNIIAATSQNQPMHIPIAQMLLFATDPGNNPLFLSAAGPLSVNGGTVAIGTDAVTYTPPTGFTGPDQFTWGVTNGLGGSAAANVLVTVYPANLPSGIMLQLIKTPNGFLVPFVGVPGQTYLLQRAESITGPWVTITSVTTDANGLGSFADPNPPADGAFYRTVYP